MQQTPAHHVARLPCYNCGSSAEYTLSSPTPCSYSTLYRCHNQRNHIKPGKTYLLFISTVAPLLLTHFLQGQSWTIKKTFTVCKATHTLHQDMVKRKCEVDGLLAETLLWSVWCYCLPQNWMNEVWIDSCYIILMVVLKSGGRVVSRHAHTGFRIHLGILQTARM